MRRVGSAKITADVSGGGGKGGASGMGRVSCGGAAFFLRGIRRGRLLNWSLLSDVTASVGGIAEGILDGRIRDV